MISDFFSHQDLSFDHVKTLATGMFDVAKVDGVHDKEMSLIREFYESCARAGDPPLEQVVKSGLDIEAAKTLFGTPELRKLFIKSLVLLAFADGTYAKAEDDLIRKYAKELGADDAEVDSLHAATKDFLLAGLAHVQNIDALKGVVKRLDT